MDSSRYELGELYREAPHSSHPDFYPSLEFLAMLSDPIYLRLCYARNYTEVCKENPCPDKSVVQFLRRMNGTGLQLLSGKADWKGLQIRRQASKFLLITNMM